MMVDSHILLKRRGKTQVSESIWLDYKRRYHDTVSLINQSIIAGTVAVTVLGNFPRKLPRDLRFPVVRFLKQIFVDTTEALGRHHSKADLPKTTRSRTIKLAGGPQLEKLRLASLSLMISQFLATGKVRVDFKRLLLSQELVMLFAHLDSFLGDSARIICRVRPEVLKSERPMTLQDIVEAGDWERLLNQMTEKLVFDLGWGSIVQRKERLKKNLGLTVTLSKGELPLIRKLEAIRNLIVHNGGRVNQEYSEEVGGNHLRVGGTVRIDSDEIWRFSETVSTICSELFVQISKRFFQKEDHDLSGVWL